MLVAKHKRVIAHCAERRLTGLHVSHKSMGEVRAHPVWIEQVEAATKTPAGCLSCKWWKVCKGGRPVNRYSKEKGFDNSSVFCEALKIVYEEISIFLLANGRELPISLAEQVLEGA
jgi:uncharacterized protein